MPKANPKVRRVKAWAVTFKGKLIADEHDWCFVSLTDAGRSKKKNAGWTRVTITYSLPPKKTE